MRNQPVDSGTIKLVKVVCLCLTVAFAASSDSINAEPAVLTRNWTLAHSLICDQKKLIEDGYSIKNDWRLNVRITDTIKTQVCQQKRTGLGHGEFAKVYEEMKFIQRGENQVGLESTGVAETRTDEITYTGKMALWSEMGVYESEKMPELIEIVRPDPTHPESIFDIPTSEWIALAVAAMDASEKINTDGLTKGELYNEIRAVFEEYLGENFLEPFYTRIGCYSDGIEYDASAGVFNVFRDVLERSGIKYHDSSVRVEAAGYAGMSNDEIKAAVREKYPKVMTLRECMVMGWELEELGATSINYARGLVDRLTFTINITSSQSREAKGRLYKKLLDFPADFDQIVCDKNLHDRNMRKYGINQDALDPITRLLSLFKVSDSSAYSAAMLMDLWLMI